VHSIYVVDDENRLKGRLSLKDLLTTSTKHISVIFTSELNSVNVDTEDVEVARNHANDLEAIPVVDEMGRLGRIHH
jgi:magnesium transporter